MLTSFVSGYVWITRMSLGSVLQTSLSGMTAATASVDVASHNLANSRTNGFKSVRPTFAEQAPSSSHGVQVGNGVRVTGFTTDDSPGPQVATSNGVVEQSNTDVGSEMIELIMAENQFKANANVFSTGNDLFDELLDLGRSRS